MSEKPFSIRLTNEEKEMLERIAKSKGVPMADIVRMWITQGDVVNVLAEQLVDLSKDFATWHLASRGSSVTWLAGILFRETPVEEDTIIQRMFQSESSHLTSEFTEFSNNLDAFVNKVKMKKKETLIAFIKSFISIVQAYHNNLVVRFYEVVAIMPEKNRDWVKEPYSNEFRVRYNEFAARYEDFLRRASRELGEKFRRTIERAKEFPERHEPWRRSKTNR